MSSHVISIMGMTILMAPRPSSNARAPSSSKSSNHHVHQRIIIIHARDHQCNLHQRTIIRHLHSSIKVISKRSYHSYRLHVHQLDQGLQSHHPKTTSSTRRLHLYNHHQPSLSKHHGLHHIIRVLMGQQLTIINNQGSNHRTVTTARVAIR
jgi:hypothetical protein